MTYGFGLKTCNFSSNLSAQLLFIKVVKDLGPRADLSSFSVMKIINYIGHDCLTWVALGNNKHFRVF